MNIFNTPNYSQAKTTGQDIYTWQYTRYKAK